MDGHTYAEVMRSCLNTNIIYVKIVYLFFPFAIKINKNIFIVSKNIMNYQKFLL